MNRPALKVVPGAGAEPVAASTQIARTRALARAFAQRRKAEAMLRAADTAIDAAFLPWAAKRSISRDQAEAHLESTGYLEPRKVWQK